MTQLNIIRMDILIIIILILSVAASATGIFSNEGEGKYELTSIRKKTVSIYGKGLYKDMSAEVAPQGIAQDYITLFIAIPLLIVSFVKSRRGSLKAKYLLTGTLLYFLVTYTFYTVMAMYNGMYLAYVAIMGASFFSIVKSLCSFDVHSMHDSFDVSSPIRTSGGFLIFNSVAIALLWLNIIIPPLLDGTVIPAQTEHYTTLIVQGFDLGILLPACFISGLLLFKKAPLGYLLGPVYFVFLSLLMTALTAKVIAMKVSGFNVFPVVIIIPLFAIITIICTLTLLKSIKKNCKTTL